MFPDNPHHQIQEEVDGIFKKFTTKLHWIKELTGQLEQDFTDITLEILQTDSDGSSKFQAEGVNFTIV